jgi:hypothetical protein
MASKRWTWVTAGALLFAGLTNAHAHAHYCFDGQAPAAAVHHADARTHTHDFHAPEHHDAHVNAVQHGDAAHHDEEDADHDDLDLDVPNDALAKTLKHDLPALHPAPLWTGVVVDHRPSVALAARLDIPPAPDPPYSHPLLRAPPR